MTKLYVQIKAFLLTLLGFMAGVFMWAGVITAAALFILGLVADMKDVAHRMILAIGIAVVCGVSIWNRYNFVGRYHARLQGQNVEWGVSKHSHVEKVDDE